MTAHELARQLLAGPDLPVTLHVNGIDPETGDWDAWPGPLHLVKAEAKSVCLCAGLAEADES